MRLSSNTDEKDSLGLPTNVAFLDKIAHVKCTSQHANAFLRVCIGLPSALHNVDGNDLNALHMTTVDGVTLPDSISAESWPWKYNDDHSRTGVSIDGVAYDMLCYEYQPVLAPSDVTAPVLAGLWLDSRLDSAEDRENHYAITVDGVKKTLGYAFSNGLQVPILAQAVQADGFSDAATAFEAAGMNNVDFDDLLDINNRQPLTKQIKNLLDEITTAFSESAEADKDAPPPQIRLEDNAYDFTNPEFNAQLQTISDCAPDGTVELIPSAPPSEDSETGSVTIILGNTSLPENILLITNESTELIIIGDE